MWFLRIIYKLSYRGLGGNSFYPIPSSLKAYFNRLPKHRRLAVYARIVEGTSFWRIAPPDLACAESVSSILNTLFGFPPIISTIKLYEYLNVSKEYINVRNPVDGCIVIAPTGRGIPGAIGHVGIYANRRIYSNNSFTGRWDAHYNLLTFKAKYQVGLGIPIYYFIPR